jgi:hypothetical protein
MRPLVYVLFVHDNQAFMLDRKKSPVSSKSHRLPIRLHRHGLLARRCPWRIQSPSRML